MKIGIEIRKEFEKIFNDVVQKNGGKPGTVARLIIESQLSFFLSRNVLPNFFQSVQFTLDKNNKELIQQSISESENFVEEDHRTLQQILDNDPIEEHLEKTEDMTSQWLGEDD